MVDRLVIHHGAVLTGPLWQPTASDLMIVDGRIEAIGAPGVFDGTDAARHDAQDRLVLPGLINAHTHSHTAVARGSSRAWTLEASLLNGPWMSAPRSAELAELCALLAGTELIASGCTGAFDLMAQAGAVDTDLLYATARGYFRSGLKVQLAPMVVDRPIDHALPAIAPSCVPAQPGPSAAELIGQCERYVAEFPQIQGITPAMAPSIPGHCSGELLVGLHRLASRHGLRSQLHLAESKPQAISAARQFGRSITAELDRLELLDDRLTVSHAIWLDQADRELLAQAGAVAVTVPGSNLRLGSGIADTRALIASGVTLAIGTDGANSADAFDALDAMRLTSLLSRVDEGGPESWLSVEETLDAATTGGAAACGWHQVGKIAPGYQADLAFVNVRSRAFTPATDLANQLITAARANDVTDVMIGGRFVYRDREFPGLSIESIIDRFNELVRDFMERQEPLILQAHQRFRDSAQNLSRLRGESWPVRRLLPGDNDENA